MALGFGKKKNEADAAAADAPAQTGSDFDTETFSLESFAADLESAGSSSAVKPPPDGNSPAGGTSTGDALSWDDTALLNFDDPNAFSSIPSNDRRGGTQEGTPFDDLARELEDIPGLPDQFPPPATPMAAAAPDTPELERKTRRRAVSANLSEAIAESSPLDAGTGKKKKEKPAKPIATDDGAKRKLPLVPIIAVAAVLLLGSGAAFMLTQGGTTEDTETTAPAPSDSSAAPPSVDAPPPPAEAASPAAEAPITPEVQVKLKDLWKQGADAKQKKDYAAARTAWEQMLRLRPGHPGVQEAIDKLPKP